MKAHPKKFYTSGKPLPMFQRLGRIFGKDKVTGTAAVSGIDAEEQVEEEPDDDGLVFDDHFMSYSPTPSQQPMVPQRLRVMQVMELPPQLITEHRLEGCLERRGSRRTSLERMADEVHDSTVAQREHVQILANAISRKNEEVKMGEKLAKLGFADHEAIQAVIKICSDPRLEKSFWGLTDAQKTTLAQDILDGKY
ncbi:hypothetical protein PIB30_076297 [Stylosanthes scabra]|uniref:Uncharacterized protein n=1 Tax=Stylosanthes scabra TaxID=79078 RepID=A0ABU6YQI8_9FABA|nr:hypothetical protein [Stylosanthes scabra]